METTVIVSVPATGLSRRVQDIVKSGACVVNCDVRALIHPDPAALDVLLRLALAARLHGGRVRLVGASPAMRDVLVFLGLAAVFEWGGDEAAG